MTFDQLVESILEEGSLLLMAQEVERRLKNNRIEKFQAIKHLKGLLSSSKEIGDRQGIKTILNKLLTEAKVKRDRCLRKADSVYGKKTSAYKSGAVVKCRQGKIWKKK